MSVYIKPTNLVRTKSYVEQLFPSKIEPSYLKDVNEVRRFIERIVKKTPPQIERFVEIMEESEYEVIKNYVVQNKYHFDCKNLFQLIGVKASFEDWNWLYSQWQDYYSNDDMRKFLFVSIKENKDAREMINNYVIDLAKIDWINQDTYIDTLGRLGKDVLQLTEYCKILEDVGVIPESNLNKKCISRFAIYCKRQAYMDMGAQTLVNFWEIFKHDDKLAFIVNFLKEIPTFDLRFFLVLYRRILASYKNEFTRNEFLDYLESHNCKKKFQQWNKLMILDDNMDPDRFEFWNRYAEKNHVEYFKTSQSILIDCGEYKIVELAGKAAGCAYVMSQEFYQSDVRFDIKTKSKNALVKLLNEYYDLGNISDKMKHLPAPGPSGWHIEFEWNLKTKYKIFPDN